MTHTIKLDETDLVILKEMQADSRISNNELARRINLSQPAAHTRLKRLKEAGVIKDFTVRLDHELLGFELVCFFQTRLQGHTEADVTEFERQVRGFPEVLECHYLTGEFDHLIKAVFKSRRDLEGFMRNRLSVIPGVAQIITSLVLSEIKSGTGLPLSPEHTE
ncbi:MAG: Lrp/AsnC family transcriptional regulator [Desulfobacterales bacterium]|nr:Lrp/AsnC family transcriptional regulator [Desulfobacterales bacterium]